MHELLTRDLQIDAAAMSPTTPRSSSSTVTVTGLAEEVPFAYEDVERVAAVVERAGLARRVTRWNFWAVKG